MRITISEITRQLPIATFACLMPFRFTTREMTFASWVGLRGAMPIYLAIVPVLAAFQRGSLLFPATFGIVIVSLILQGWTISPFARLLGFSNGPLAGRANAEIL